MIAVVNVEMGVNARNNVNNNRSSSCPTAILLNESQTIESTARNLRLT